jgi:predicted NodU family carbamoyl transferase
MITLGLSYSQMHNSSACLVRDGNLLFMVAEEHIRRVQHDARFPGVAIRACLDFAKIRAGRVDEVCVGWQTLGATFRHDLKLYATLQWPISYLNVLNSTRHFANIWRQNDVLVSPSS